MCIVGLVVEFSPATRGARVRFPDDAIFLDSNSDDIIVEEVEYYVKSSNFVKNVIKKILPVGESNPGLPRDRRGYLPLY